MFRAGVYARVSTNDQQTIPLQIRALREYAVRRGWTLALQVKEVGNGASERQLREKLLDAARPRSSIGRLPPLLQAVGAKPSEIVIGVDVASQRFSS